MERGNLDLGNFNMKKFLLVLIFSFFTVSCASTHFQIQPAVATRTLNQKDIVRAEFDTMSADTRSDKTAAIVVGTLIGAIILSGIIVPIVVLSD
ncbi:MAG: hypothetical protein HYU97_10115 [Deltaproteobacteria bacterium]|nr:hypothetical protein [Deltaproteobacteria bacterium]